MTLVNTHQAKTHLSKLLEQVKLGEEIVIGKAGVPIAKLVLFQEKSQKRQGGQWEGKIKIAKDFDKTPKEVIDSFYNSKL